MGAQIALHCANAGVPALLLDMTADLAKQGLEKARKLKPDPQFTPDAYKLVTTGGFDTDLDRIAKTDWIMEAVVERLDIKQQLLARIDEKRRQGSIVSSNTSGIPIATLAEGRSEDFRRHWLGTHFFNPPRYLRLLEVIPTPDTSPDVVECISQFADHRLGKGVVVAKDTPNFIANHIGLFGVIQTLRVLESGEYTIEEIDAITGPALGRPKSATFRTMDLAGIDVLAHVARNLAERLPQGEAFVLPPLVETLIARGSIGEKAGQGFYKRTPGAYTIEEIDAITGPALGRPKSATFRTMDLAGIDVLAHVARNLAERLPQGEAFVLPPLVETLIARGSIGEKAGQGFYKRTPGAS